MRKDEYIKLRQKGMTYDEIAKQYGVSKQAVEQAIHPRKLKINCVYPVIEAWMQDHHMTVAKFADLLGVRYCTARYVLSGEEEPKKTFIDSVRNATGFTYEEAFCMDMKIGHEEAFKHG